MFTRIALCAVIVWLGMAAALWQLRFPPAEEVSSPKKHLFAQHPAKQVRHGVQKDIWTAAGLHFRLQSENSVLALQQQRGKVKAVETLGNLECCLQEAVDVKTGTQQVRYLTAPKGTYTFPEHRFVADEVHLSFYQLPGLELPPGKPTGEPFVSGIAEEVVFSEVDHAPHLHAHHLKAKVSSDGL